MIEEDHILIDGVMSAIATGDPERLARAMTLDVCYRLATLARQALPRRRVSLLMYHVLRAMRGDVCYGRMIVRRSRERQSTLVTDGNVYDTLRRLKDVGCVARDADMKIGGRRACHQWRVTPHGHKVAALWRRAVEPAEAPNA